MNLYNALLRPISNDAECGKITVYKYEERFTEKLTFVGDVLVVSDEHHPSDVVTVVEDGRLLLEHDFHLVHQLLHRSRCAEPRAE